MALSFDHRISGPLGGNPCFVLGLRGMDKRLRAAAAKVECLELHWRSNPEKVLVPGCGAQRWLLLTVSPRSSYTWKASSDFVTMQWKTAFLWPKPVSRPDSQSILQPKESTFPFF